MATQEKSNYPNPDVRLGVDRGVIRLQFSAKVSRSIYCKKQFYKSLGREDNPINREWAKRIADRIQQDLDHPDNLFDPSLEKYLGCTIINFPNSAKSPKLLELWDNYCEWKLSSGQIAETTYKTRHKRTFQKWLKPYLEREVNRQLVTDLSSELLNADNCKLNLKKLFNALVEMGDRSVRRGILNVNYFIELKEINFRIEKKSQQLQEEEDFRSFTLQERDSIITAFYHSDKLAEKQIATLIEFLFLTGCRLGEAFALKWKDIKQDWIVFDESYSTETRITKSTKTDTIRIFKTTGYDKLLMLLNRVKERKHHLDKDDYVFLKLNNKPYNRLNLSALWLGIDKSKNGQKYYYDGVVTRLVKLGLVEQYLKPSSTRHTFITLQSQNGVDLKLLADSCGNSIDVIYNHYLGINRESKLLNL